MISPMKRQGSILTPEMTDCVNVRIDVTSYMQHSERLKHIQQTYEGLLKENESLRTRLNKLKAQYDTETAVMKQA